MTRLARMLRSYRSEQKISMRTAANQMGLTLTTLHRIENASDGDMTAHTFILLANWMLSRSGNGTRR